MSNVETLHATSLHQAQRIGNELFQPVIRIKNTQRYSFFISNENIFNSSFLIRGRSPLAPSRTSSAPLVRECDGAISERDRSGTTEGQAQRSPKVMERIARRERANRCLN